MSIFRPSPTQRAAATELALALLAMVLFAWLGELAGWKGRPRTVPSTALWPFYFDTWLMTPQWTWRALLPPAAFAIALVPARRFVGGEARWWPLPLFLAAAYLVHYSLGVERHGFVGGFTFTFSRWQEYWADVKLVHGDFLARFPEVGRLSQHGATHPPGLTLVLAGLRALGVTRSGTAEAVCSTACVLTALPLYGAARRLASEDIARFAVALFVFACSVSAFAVLAMDVVTMLFATLALYGFCLALDGKWLGGVVWGVFLAVASTCNFIVLTLPISYAVLLAARRRTLAPRALAALAVGPLAFLAVYALLVFGFGYRPLHVYQACAKEFARSDDMRRDAIGALVGNPLAFLGALGLPLLGLAAHAIGSALARAWHKRDLDTAVLVLAAAAPPALCIAMLRPRGEVEHVFMLFVPLMVLGAAAAARRWYGRGTRWLLYVALPLLVAQSTLLEVFYETYW